DGVRRSADAGQGAVAVGRVAAEGHVGEGDGGQVVVDGCAIAGGLVAGKCTAVDDGRTTNDVQPAAAVGRAVALKGAVVDFQLARHVDRPAEAAVVVLKQTAVDRGGAARPGINAPTAAFGAVVNDLAVFNPKIAGVEDAAAAVVARVVVLHRHLRQLQRGEVKDARTAFAGTSDKAILNGEIFYADGAGTGRFHDAVAAAAIEEGEGRASAGEGEGFVDVQLFVVGASGNLDGVVISGFVDGGLDGAAGAARR